MSQRLKTIAENAVRSLAHEMLEYGEFPANWKAIDRIEARFSIQGCGTSILEYERNRQKNYQDERRARALQRNPDNAFHLLPVTEISRLSRIAALLPH